MLTLHLGSWTCWTHFILKYQCLKPLSKKKEYYILPVTKEYNITLNNLKYADCDQFNTERNECETENRHMILEVRWKFNTNRV